MISVFPLGVQDIAHLIQHLVGGEFAGPCQSYELTQSAPSLLRKMAAADRSDFYLFLWRFVRASLFGYVGVGEGVDARGQS